MNHASEIAHDTKLLELLTELARSISAQADAEATLIRYVTKYRRSHTGEVSWSEGTMPKRGRFEDLVDGDLYYQAKTFIRGEEGYRIKQDDRMVGRLATIADALPLVDSTNRYQLEAAAKVADTKTARLLAVDAVIEHEKAYTGWNRFFLVTSSAGHVHRSMSCSTCFPTTAYAPVVALSGQDDQAAVELLGESLCTVCFPEAPVTGKPAKITAAKARKLVA